MVVFRYYLDKSDYNFSYQFNYIGESRIINNLSIRVIRWITKFVLFFADLIHVISTFTRKQVISIGVNANKIKVYSLGPNNDVVDKKEVILKKTAKKVGSNNKKEILFVGRIVKRKGVRYLIDSLPIVLQKYPETLLKIVGAGLELSKLQDIVKEKKIDKFVRFSGPISNYELALCYNSCDVFVLPSIIDETGDTEGLGLVLLEALFYGKPIVGSNVGGIPDIISDGITGLLVNQKDPVSLAKSIVKIFTNSSFSKKLIMEGQKLLLNKFNWSVGAKQKYSDYISEINKYESELSLV